MSDEGERTVDLASVDPDEQGFRADTLLMHAELLALELYAVRRKWFKDPQVDKVNVGSGQPTEQTLRGHQKEPFNGLVIYNPTPVTLSIGFQAGTAYLAPATVPPFTWVAFPTRFVNLSIAQLNPVDQQTAVAQPVTVVRSLVPVQASAGPFSAIAPTVGQTLAAWNGVQYQAVAAVWSPPLGAPSLGVVTGEPPVTSITNGGALASGAALDNGATTRSHHSLVVVTGAGVTGGTVTLQGSQDNNNWFNSTAAVNVAAANTTYAANLGNFPLRYIRAAITTAIVGGTISATVASSG